MRITLKIKTVSGEDFKSACKAAEIVVATQALKDTIPFVPALTGVFAATGKGPMNIPSVGLRWHKGATLTPTAKDLVFTTDMHPQAQSHWMDASYKKNGGKWARVAEKAVISSLG